jgi:SPIRAL1-like protein
MAALSAIEVNDVLKGLLLKDLRTNCRARQISPAGGRDALIERIAEHMTKTQNYDLVREDGTMSSENIAPKEVQTAKVGNNYNRSEGQNVGNFITDKPSSRVLAPPGGGSQICFGTWEEPKPQAAASPMRGASEQTSLSNMGHSPSGNNYHRPGGQNVGNFITDRPSSRVMAPPGGISQITFG